MTLNNWLCLLAACPPYPASPQYKEVVTSAQNQLSMGHSKTWTLDSGLNNGSIIRLEFWSSQGSKFIHPYSAARFQCSLICKLHKLIISTQQSYRRDWYQPFCWDNNLAKGRCIRTKEVVTSAQNQFSMGHCKTWTLDSTTAR